MDKVSIFVNSTIFIPSLSAAVEEIGKFIFKKFALMTQARSTGLVVAELGQLAGSLAGVCHGSLPSFAGYISLRV